MQNNQDDGEAQAVPDAAPEPSARADGASSAEAGEANVSLPKRNKINSDGDLNADTINQDSTVINGNVYIQGAGDVLQAFFRTVKVEQARPEERNSDNVPEELPQKSEDVDHWFYQILTEEERAYVIALCFLHGGTNAVVETGAARILRLLLTEEERKSISSPLHGIRRPHLTTIIGRSAKSEAELIEFADVNIKGISRLRELLRPVLDSLWDYSFTGMSTSRSLREEVMAWCKTSDPDLAVAACRGWGWYLARASRSSLKTQLNAWAESDSIEDGLAAAAACLGILWAVDDSQDNDAHQQNVDIHKWTLSLVKEWTTAGTRPKDNNKRWTAAVTWGALAGIEPEAAEDGLTLLMKRDEDGASLPLSLVQVLVLSWRSLAEAGNLRHVIKRLAEEAQVMTHILLAKRESRLVTLQREHADRCLLVVALTIVTLGNVGSQREAILPDGQQALSHHIGIYDQTGANNCLALVLNEEEHQAQEHLLTMLVASIGGRIGHQLLLFTTVLTPWARLMQDAPSHVKWAFARFANALALHCRKWDEDLRASGLEARAVWRLRSQVERWRTIDSGKLAPLYECIITEI